MYKFDVSVVVAVYNNEEFIGECIESVVTQKYDLEKIQLILVNDGSTDKSLDICREYEKKYNNILVIDQENKGVSVARNEGIKKAQGKYIMILDSDDLISSDSVKLLVEFFDNNYDNVDLVTYPIYHLLKDGEKTKFKRYDVYDKGTGIYDLDEYISINQATINIITKNENEKNILFDPEMKLAEDQKYNIEHLTIKKKIGYVEEAIYYYRKHESSVSTQYNNPLYCFDSILKYNEWLVKNFKDENGKTYKFIQVYVINTFNWRLKSDQLYPYYQEKEEFDKSVDRIKGVLKHIDVETIVNSKNINKYHKFYFLNLKGSEIKIDIANNDYKVYADNVLAEEAKDIDLQLNKFRVKNNKLEILGVLFSVILMYKKPKLFLVTKDNDNKINRKELNLFKSNWSKYKTEIEIMEAYGFETEIDITNIKLVYFEVEIDDKYVFNVNYVFSKFAPFLKSKYFRTSYFGKKYIICRKKIEIKNSAIFLRLRDEIIKNLVLLIRSRGTILYRFLSRLYKKNKRIWLYADRNGIFDNGYCQFIYDEKQEDGIERYYIYDDNFEKIKDKFEGIDSKKLVHYGTLKHKLLFINSEKILTSFQSLSIYSPLHRTIKYYRDILKYDLIYLQHGILHCNLPLMYSNENNEIDKIIVSSEFEKNNMKKNYNYFDKNIISSGMPRFDFINNNEPKEIKIVFAPTWRKNLIGGLKNNRREILEKVFLESNYYKKINELLTYDRFKNLLEKNNIEFEFKLHPIFKDYLPYFKTECKNIKVNAEAIDLSEYKLFITDYSSYVFDFVYLKRPIAYFLTDEKEFNAGLHTYRKLDLELEDAFGPITNNAEDLVDVIEEFIKNNFKASNIYEKRIENFFNTREPNHRKELYKSLMEGE